MEERMKHGGKRPNQTGRPRLADEPLRPAPFRLPPATLAAIQAGAQLAGLPPGLYVAEAIERYQEGKP